MTLLNQLAVGQKGLICGYAKGNPAVLQRMVEMGLIRGTEVRVVRFAPMGDPMEISVRNYQLSVRLNEAALVQVKILD